MDEKVKAVVEQMEKEKGVFTVRCMWHVNDVRTSAFKAFVSTRIR